MQYPTIYKHVILLEPGDHVEVVSPGTGWGHHRVRVTCGDPPRTEDILDLSDVIIEHAGMQARNLAAYLQALVPAEGEGLKVEVVLGPDLLREANQAARRGSAWLVELEAARATRRR